MWPELVPVWRKQTDVFSAFHAHQFGAQVYVTSGNQPRFVSSEQITPGLFEMLGALPRWGRPFVNDDARPGQPAVVILAEEIATQEFGSPARAIGQRLRADPTLPVVVGVMWRLILDSGVRRGSDIVKALALGAKAVLTGRATLYGTAAGGEAGALKAINILKNEADKTMA